MAISLHYDSHAAIRVAHNSVHNRKNRHIRIKHSAVKHMLKHDAISLEYVRYELNLADPLTKYLTRRIVLEMSRGIGLKPMD